MYEEPIRQIYPRLSAEQQRAVRQLLVKRFSRDITRWLRETTRQIGPQAVILKVNVEKGFIEGAGEIMVLQEKLFELAQQQQCDSILKLAAEILSSDLSVADEAGQDGEVDTRKIALDESGKMQKILRDAFPDLPWQTLLSEVRRERGITDRPRR